MNDGKQSPHPALGDWDDIRFVLALSRAGSLKEAAQRLGVNQSTVYRRINRCEAELSVRLFERSPQGHRLTLAGEQLVNFGVETEHRLNDLMTNLQGHDLRLTGSLHITSTDVTAISMLVPALADFRAQYPGIEVHLGVDSHRYDLTRREADIALRPTLDPPPHLSGVKLLEGQWAIYGDVKAHVPSTEAEMRSFDSVIGDEELAALPAMQWFSERVAPERVVLRTASVSTSVDTVLSHGGICLLPDFFGDTNAALKRSPINTGQAIQVWLLTHPEIRKAARVRAFFDFFIERFAYPRMVNSASA